MYILYILIERGNVYIIYTDREGLMYIYYIY